MEKYSVVRKDKMMPIRLVDKNSKIELALHSSKFKAVPIKDFDKDKAMEEVRKLIKKNPKTLEILKY